MKYRYKKDLKKGDLIDTNLGSDVCEEVKEGRWKPENGNKYYIMKKEFFYWYNDEVDKLNYSTGNVFRTEEEAEKALARQEAIVELEDLCDWEDGIFYSIYYNRYGAFAWHYSNFVANNPWRFATKASVENAIKTLGDEKLRLIFRIEE